MQIQKIQQTNYHAQQDVSFGLKIKHSDLENIYYSIRREKDNNIPEVYTILNHIKNIPSNRYVNIRTNGNVTNANFDNYHGYSIGNSIGNNIIKALKNAFIETHPTAATDKMPRALFEMECLENNGKTMSQLKELMLSIEA